MGLQIGPRLDYKLGQLLGLPIGAKRLQIGAGITNQGKEITNWCGTVPTTSESIPTKNTKVT